MSSLETILPVLIASCCNMDQMPTKKKTAPEPNETAAEGPILEKAAKAIGAALGTFAARTGMAHPEPPPKRGKLVSKNKKRLPRKQKKSLKKAAESE